MQSQRYEQGWKMLERIDGDAGKQVTEALGDVAPDLARYVVEFPFGDVYSRPGLGTATPQLEVHIHGALNVGCSREEITEVIIQMAVYAGFPAAINGALAAKRVFAQRDERTKE
jgi:4-carboxymuconolactone decarboxylase